MKDLVLSILRYASLPFALLYGIIIWLRNRFYDWNIFTSTEFSLPVICVGNITVGGTGKSPHIEHLIELLLPQYKLATLSRGYGRRTQGFRLADAGSNAREIGDEPFQFKFKYPSVEVCVAEERMTAIPRLLQQRQGIQVILLDDAFQHRTVKAGLNILLTDYGRLFTRDYIMPFGLLRESRKASGRAHIIVVSKCDEHMSVEEKNRIKAEIAPNPNQTIFFSAITYGALYPLQPELPLLPKAESVLLVTGIANPKPLKERLEREFKEVHILEYKDHHYYTEEDIQEINAAFKHITNPNKIIITTEKDASRLMLQQQHIVPLKLPIYAQRIGIKLLFDEEETFHDTILQFVEDYYPQVIYEEVFAETE